jgi:DNA-directed RNA polymerase alpha subunit
VLYTDTSFLKLRKKAEGIFNKKEKCEKEYKKLSMLVQTFESADADDARSHIQQALTRHHEDAGN